MRRLLMMMVVGLCVLLSCDKQSISQKAVVNDLTGNWRYTENFYSIGGPLIYVSTSGLKQWIQFDADGSFTSNVDQFKNFSSYQNVDSVKIKFFSKAQSEDKLYYIVFDKLDHSLSLSPADPICIEGCGDKFRK